MKHTCLPLVEVSAGKVVMGYADPLKFSDDELAFIRAPSPMKRSAHLTIQEFDLTLPYMVSGKNSVKTTRTGHRYPNERFVKWRSAVLSQLERHALSRVLNNPHVILRCDIRYWPNDKRTRDVPGMEDALYHCLERAGIIANDGQIKHSSFTTEAMQDEVKLIVSLRVCP